jgi:hypothetical protein
MFSIDGSNGVPKLARRFLVHSGSIETISRMLFELIDLPVLAITCTNYHKPCDLVKFSEFEAAISIPASSLSGTILRLLRVSLFFQGARNFMFKCFLVTSST